MLVIIVTNLDDSKVINKAYQPGAHSYLNKTGHSEEFEGFVEFVRGLGRITKPAPAEVQSQRNAII
jgi:hypothetical protein